MAWRVIRMGAKGEHLDTSGIDDEPQCCIDCEVEVEPLDIPLCAKCAKKYDLDGFWKDHDAKGWPEPWHFIEGTDLRRKYTKKCQLCDSRFRCGLHPNKCGFWLLGKKRREELRERIMGDVHDNLHDYRNFVKDCVRSYISAWSDADLLDWVGEKE